MLSLSDFKVRLRLTQRKTLNLTFYNLLIFNKKQNFSAFINLFCSISYSANVGSIPPKFWQAALGPIALTTMMNWLTARSRWARSGAALSRLVAYPIVSWSQAHPRLLTAQSCWPTPGKSARQPSSCGIRPCPGKSALRNHLTATMCSCSMPWTTAMAAWNIATQRR